MSHWFHRSPLKATAPASFDSLKSAAKTPAAAKICGDLRASRAKLLLLLTDPGNSWSNVESAANEYFAIVQGLCQGVGGMGESTLRKVVTFKWTDTICGSQPSSLADGYFELVSMVVELGIWHMKHASKIASNPGISEEEAKEVYKSLRQASGIFQQAKDLASSCLGTGILEKHGDTDARVLDAYHLQCLAEAQEVTVARSIELKHKAPVTSAVANETSKLFSTAESMLSSVDPAKAGKWRKYLQLKRDFYLAYAHSFNGEKLLTDDECGKAIKSLQEAQKLYESAGRLCRDYASTKGPGSTAKPGDHPFFTRLGPIINQRLEKATRENGFIYHHKVPAEIPELQSTEYGVASPMAFSLPDLNAVWTQDVVAGFDMTMAGKQAPTSKEEVKPIKEPEISTKTGHGKNETGCVIS